MNKLIYFTMYDEGSQVIVCIPEECQTMDLHEVYAQGLLFVKGSDKEDENGRKSKARDSESFR